jgi:hypothetical protein
MGREITLLLIIQDSDLEVIKQFLDIANWLAEIYIPILDGIILKHATTRIAMLVLPPNKAKFECRCDWATFVI